LAALSTRAVLDGDDYVVTGQKIWSSHAHHSDWAMLLARTGPPESKHRGISYFILDMSTPGIECRPIRALLGTEHFCEVFFTDVQIPRENLLGSEGQGWKIAQTTLETERSIYLLPVVSDLADQSDRLVEILKGTGEADRAAHEQAVARDYAEVAIVQELLYRILLRASFGKTGPESSVMKVVYSEVAQRLTADAFNLLGMPAQEQWEPAYDLNAATFDGKWGRAHYWSWAWTIAGGSNEIQRNIIAERVLGLPREPRVGHK
jgi:alkylation response protein AidB-like acyl-CoA dehydrogenase